MKRYIRAMSAGAIIDTVYTPAYPDGSLRYHVYYHPTGSKTYYSEAELPKSVVDFMKTAYYDEEHQEYRRNKERPQPYDHAKEMAKPLVKFEDINTEDIQLDTSRGWLTVTNYRFDDSGWYRNSSAHDIYYEPFYPIGETHGVSYGIIGTKGHYYGYKLEGDIMYCNNHFATNKLKAMQYIKEDMRDDIANWSVIGRVIK